MLASGKIVRANPRAGKKARREMTVPFFHITLFSLRCTKKALEGRAAKEEWVRGLLSLARPGVNAKAKAFFLSYNRRFVRSKSAAG